MLVSRQCTSRPHQIRPGVGGGGALHIKHLAPLSKPLQLGVLVISGSNSSSNNNSSSTARTWRSSGWEGQKARARGEPAQVLVEEQVSCSLSG